MSITALTNKPLSIIQIKSRQAKFKTLSPRYNKPLSRYRLFAGLSFVLSFLLVVLAGFLMATEQTLGIIPLSAPSWLAAFIFGVLHFGANTKVSVLDEKSLRIARSHFELSELSSGQCTAVVKSIATLEAHPYLNKTVLAYRDSVVDLGRKLTYQESELIIDIADNAASTESCVLLHTKNSMRMQ